MVPPAERPVSRLDRTLSIGRSARSSWILAATQDEEGSPDQREHAAGRGSEEDERGAGEHGERATQDPLGGDRHGDGPHHSHRKQHQDERGLPSGGAVEQELGLWDDRDEAPCESQSGACLLQVVQALEGHDLP